MIATAADDLRPPVHQLNDEELDVDLLRGSKSVSASVRRITNHVLVTLRNKDYRFY
jgi:hypothetical protein